MKIIDATKDDIDDNPDMGRRIRANRKSDRLRALRFATAFVALFAAQLSSARADETKPLLPKWTITELDSRYVIRDAPLYWIDNDRVLFSAFFRDPPISDRKALIDQYRAENPHQLFVWDLRGSVMPLSSYASDYCFGAGKIFRTVRLEAHTPFRDGWDYLTGRLYKPQVYLFAPISPTSIIDAYGPRIFYVRGEIGREEADDRRARMNAEFRFSELDCRIAPRPAAVSNTSLWVPLLPNDGVIRFEASGEKSILRFGPQSTDKVILPLKFDRRFSVSPNITFHPFKGAYFLWQQSAYWIRSDNKQKAGECRYAYWLFPDGKIEEVCLPPGPWSSWDKDGIAAIPLAIRDGFLFVRQNKGGNAVSNDGVYLFSLNSAERVYRAFVGQPRVSDRSRDRAGRFSNLLDFNLVRGANVSPDGCRAAFALAPTESEYRRTGGRRIVAYDFCPVRQ